MEPKEPPLNPPLTSAINHRWLLYPFFIIKPITCSSHMCCWLQLTWFSLILFRDVLLVASGNSILGTQSAASPSVANCDLIPHNCRGFGTNWCHSAWGGGQVRWLEQILWPQLFGHDYLKWCLRQLCNFLGYLLWRRTWDRPLCSYWNCYYSMSRLKHVVALVYSACVQQAHVGIWWCSHLIKSVQQILYILNCILHVGSHLNTSSAVSMLLL